MKVLGMMNEQENFLVQDITELDVQEEQAKEVDNTHVFLLVTRHSKFWGEPFVNRLSCVPM